MDTDTFALALAAAQLDARETNALNAAYAAHQARMHTLRAQMTAAITKAGA